MPSPPLGPLLLRSSLHETIWGGQRLATVAGKRLPLGTVIGESWETAIDSVVREGPLAGNTLAEVVDLYGVELIGARAEAVYGPRFPLLAKFLDANQWLSVQTHPDDTYAAQREHGKLGKTEAWYILHAEPGAQLVYGLSRPASSDEVRAAIAQSRLEELLQYIPARAGDVIFVPPGTVHAIGAGVVLYELQEYSDVTYRLYDYGRLQANGLPRELHVEEGLAVMRFEPSGPGRVKPVSLALPNAGARGEQRLLVGCHYFLEEELAFHGKIAARTAPTSCVVLTAIGGSCEIRTVHGAVELAHGDTAVLPACLGEYMLESSGVRLMRSSVPEADDELLAQWRQAQ